MVANNADGNIALFQPGENGLALSSVSRRPDFPILRAGTGQLQRWKPEFYAQPTARRPRRCWDFSSKRGGSSGLSVSEAGGSAQLLSAERELAGLDRHTVDDHARDAGRIVRRLNRRGCRGAGGAGQSSSGHCAHPKSPKCRGPAVQTGRPHRRHYSWARYVMGLDQAIESISRSDARLLHEEQPTKVRASPTQPCSTNNRQADQSTQPQRWISPFWGPARGWTPKTSDWTPSTRRSARGA